LYVSDIVPTRLIICIGSAKLKELKYEHTWYNFINSKIVYEAETQTSLMA